MTVKFIKKTFVAGDKVYAAGEVAELPDARATELITAKLATAAAETDTGTGPDQPVFSDEGK